MKFFRGDIIAGSFQVHLCEGVMGSPMSVILRPLRDIHTGSDGFSWGSVGNGADDLALAICSEILGHHAKVKVARFVAEELIVPLDPDEDWTLGWTRVLDSMARADGSAGSGLGQVRR